jgi:nickel/cobalt exporter
VSHEFVLLGITAASIGLFHTLLGPDHYLPFIVMARARGWSVARTAWITFLCGLGHIGSSVLLGLIGVAFGLAASQLTAVESFRGGLAAWALIAFGLVYFVWGVRRAWRHRPHTHWHHHVDGTAHLHEHRHAAAHVHPHAAEEAANLTPWVLFTVFVFGPCEPLIPLVMYPAARHSLWGVGVVTAVFGAATILTMLGVVLVSLKGITLLPVQRLERYSHALAGATIMACGVAIEFMGL